MLLAGIFPSDLRRPGIDDGFRAILSLGFSPSLCWRGRPRPGRARVNSINNHRVPRRKIVRRNTVMEERERGTPTNPDATFLCHFYVFRLAAMWTPSRLECGMINGNRKYLGPFFCRLVRLFVRIVKR